MPPYDAHYTCTKCKHKYTVRQGEFGCPPGYEGPDCGAGDPAECKYYPQMCWGCSPCGKSRRRYRCTLCIKDTSCPKCGSNYVKWENFKEIARRSPDGNR